MRFIVAFCISILVLALALWFAKRHPKKQILALTVGTYLMLSSLVFPFGNVNEPLGIIRNIFLSLVKSAQIFGLNSEFGAEVELLNTPRWFAWLYSIWLSILYVVAPIMTASFLLTLSRTTRDWFKWKLNHKKEMWIFTEPSNKALLFAESVLKDPNESIGVLFCDVDDEHYERVTEIGGIAAVKKIDELDEDYFNRRPTTLLFMGEDEERNLAQTLTFVQKRKEAIKKPTLLYCFNSKAESGLMLNAVDKQTDGKIRFRRIAENKAVVFQELMKISNELGEKKPGDKLHILIVGCGWIGMELLKALLWCFVRYNLVIDVIDKKSTELWFYRSCPGLKDRNGGEFNINFLPNEDVRTLDISDIDNARTIEHVFIALGNDIINMECAVYLRQAFRKLHRQNSCEENDLCLQKPGIHVVINNPGNQSLELIDHKISYDIRPFIEGQNYYTAYTLLNYEIEKQALISHLSWMLFYANNDAENGIPSQKLRAQELAYSIEQFVHNELQDGNLAIENHSQWRKLVFDNEVISRFYNDDYNSWSSRARAVFDWCDSRFPHSAEIEHKRWLMYMLTEGYQHGDITDHVAKLHKDIVDDFNDERDLKYQDILEKLNGR